MNFYFFYFYSFDYLPWVKQCMVREIKIEFPIFKMLLDIDCLVRAMWVIDFNNLPCVRFLTKVLNSSCEKLIVNDYLEYSHNFF